MRSFISQGKYRWTAGGFCVSRDGDEVILCDKPESGGSYVFQRYDRTGQWLNTWQEKCEHDCSKHLLRLRIGNTPYIAMSCWKCQSITLYSMTDSDPITAYCDSGDDQDKPYAMCHGPDKTILASNWRPGSKEVLMYNTTSSHFTLKDRIHVDVDQAFHIHYMETAKHGGILIVSRYDIMFRKPNVISAHSVVHKAPVWKLGGKEIEGKLFAPSGMCSDPETGALYVGDWINERLIVIDSNTGEVIQSIQLRGVGLIGYIAWCSVQPHIVLHHWKYNMYQITNYSME